MRASNNHSKLELRYPHLAPPPPPQSRYHGHCARRNLKKWETIAESEQSTASRGLGKAGETQQVSECGCHTGRHAVH